MVADWNILQPYEIKFSMLHCMCQGASDNCLNYFTNVSLLLARVVMFVSRLPCRISPNICHCLHVAGGHGAFNFIDWPVNSASDFSVDAWRLLNAWTSSHQISSSPTQQYIIDVQHLYTICWAVVGVGEPGCVLIDVHNHWIPWNNERHKLVDM